MKIECRFLMSNGFEKIEVIEFQSGEPTSSYQFRRFVCQPEDSPPIYEDIFFCLEEFVFAHKKHIAFYKEEE